MRHIEENEKVIIAELLRVAGCQSIELNGVTVEVIDTDTGTLRSSHLQERQRLKAVADTHFSDIDGGYVEIILFVDDAAKFGELSIWKADGTLVQKLPSQLCGFDEIKSINPT